MGALPPWPLPVVRANSPRVFLTRRRPGVQLRLTKAQHIEGMSTNSFEEIPLPLFQNKATRVQKSQKSRLPSYIRDHRQRLRERFMAGGGAALPDYELLELLLFRAIPRQDVKPLAHALLKTFGSYNAVLSAPVESLRRVSGVGDAVICELKLIEAAAHRLAQSRILRRRVVSSWEALIDYCQTTMSYSETEQFHVLFLDTKNTLIADERQATGTVDHVPVYPREIVKRALELNASALILVHNHPSGDPTPSSADIEVTRQVQSACAALSITLHDHLIIGKACEVSFRSCGLLED